MIENTNEILKKILCNTKDPMRKEYFLRILKVNAGTCNPIDFTGQKYHKLEHDKNMFIYLNDKYEIIGMLEGNVHEIRFEYHEVNKDIKKNRKSFEANSSIVLMFTPDMRIWHHQTNYRLSKKQRDWKFKETDKMINLENLKKRLQEYKRLKHGNLEPETLLIMAKKIVNYLIDAMIAKDKSLYMEKIRKIEKNYEEWCVLKVLFNNLINDLEYYQMYRDEPYNIDYAPRLKDISVTVTKWYSAIFGNVESEMFKVI
jgi:hypothetical protein